MNEEEESKNYEFIAYRLALLSDVTVEISKNKFNVLNLLISKLAQTLDVFNNLIDNFVPDDVQSVIKNVRIILDKQKFTDPMLFF